MKIAIPTNEKKLDTSVCISFGRALYYLLYDTESKVTEFLDNTAAGVQGGAGLKAAQILVDRGTDILLTARCGQNAADVLRMAEVNIYKTECSGAKEALVAFLEGKLAPMTQFHVGFHGYHEDRDPKR
ncbi:MAG: NifB/NifX family molybdenum-iron cluster-binding protein [Pyramidobacter sp.]|uniref:NifB/NifX family molybdenum-iron cluster-binding protein n=1 Tax=Pyramidobacter sp. TaxID=1943581 RepID=UPI002A803083|nr:NifB/NifX family molybdenum-iron cluster-binding protein [Pyramidobacter sp.]MDY4033320.1 NifB/NifX family molybdenum-iron cluster-binding protein [Pyramidobacter sp.]